MASIITPTASSSPASVAAEVAFSTKPSRDSLTQWILSDPHIIQSFHTVTWVAAKRGAPTSLHSSSILCAQKSLCTWSNDPYASPVRWISGWAGAGKTTVAQKMAEYWAKQRRLAGSFFFSR
ncbi:hypothetical protein BDN72DRAFT_774396, partial [Pluteus cervinus]